MIYIYLFHKKCTMKLFQKLLKFYQMMGIFPPHSFKNYKQNLKTCLFVLSFMHFFTSSSTFFLFHANSIRERIESFIETITILVCVIFISICKCKMAETLKIIENFEQFIEKSKYWIHSQNKAERALSFYLRSLTFSTEKSGFCH